MRSTHPTIRDHETHQQRSLNTDSARIPIGHTLSTLTEAAYSRIWRPGLRAMIQDLLREADRGELQLTYKLLKALLR